MANHHHQPAHLLSQWACADAFKLVRGQPEVVAAHDALLLRNASKRRKWPICVQRKDPERALPEGRRWGRSTPEHTCCREGLYAFPRPETDAERGLAWLMFQMSDADRTGVQARSIGDLVDLASRFDDRHAERAEKALADRVDTPVATVLEIIRGGGRPTARQRGILATFLTLAHLRGPVWLRGDYPEMLEAALRKRRAEFVEGLSRSMTRADAAVLVDLMDAVQRRVMFAVAVGKLAASSWDVLRKVDPRFTVLEAAGSTRFVFADNPARAWDPSRPHALATLARIGMKRRSARITFPISPRHCLVVRSGRRIPRWSRRRATEQEVRSINTALLTFALEEIVYPSPDRDVFLPGVDPDAVVPWVEPRYRAGASH